MAESYDPRNLLRVLDASLDESELRRLAFNLNVDYDDLSGVKSDKVIELIQYLKRHNRLDELVKAIRQTRPDILLDEMGERHKYYLASKKPDETVASQVNLSAMLGSTFEPTQDFDQADVIIFDLDNPPPDWPRYLAEWRRRDVQLMLVTGETNLQELDRLELDGKIILYISKELLGLQESSVLKGQAELSGALKQLATLTSRARNVYQDSRRMAMRG